jgi:ribosomal protein S18
VHTEGQEKGITRERENARESERKERRRAAPVSALELPTSDFRKRNCLLRFVT